MSKIPIWLRSGFIHFEQQNQLIKSNNGFQCFISTNIDMFRSMKEINN